MSSANAKAHEELLDYTLTQLQRVQALMWAAEQLMDCGRGLGVDAMTRKDRLSRIIASTKFLGDSLVGRLDQASGGPEVQRGTLTDLLNKVGAGLGELQSLLWAADMMWLESPDLQVGEVELSERVEGLLRLGLTHVEPLIEMVDRAWLGGHTAAPTRAERLAP